MLIGYETWTNNFQRVDHIKETFNQLVNFLSYKHKSRHRINLYKIAGLLTARIQVSFHIGYKSQSKYLMWSVLRMGSNLSKYNKGQVSKLIHPGNLAMVQ